MNKKYAQQKKDSYKSYIFWGLIALVTLVFLTWVVIRFFESRTVNSYDSLEQLEGENLLKLNGKYIVFVYDSEKEKNIATDEFDKLVFDYITFAKRNGSNEDVFPIYGFDIQKPENKKILISSTSGKSENVYKVSDYNELLIKYDNVPVLLIIDKNAVADYKNSDNTISKYLQGIMDENK